MDMVGMVALGEYSSGCVCQVRGRKMSADLMKGAATAAGGAATGVVMQSRRAAQQNR
jgi:hypothetical protein